MKKTTPLLVAACLAYAPMTATVAQAGDLITADKPAEILNLARGFGSARMDTDSTGDPLIIGRIDGTKYGIYFYGCNDGRSCDDIQFTAAWGDVDASMDDINTYNRKKRFGKGYIDHEGDPVLEMAVNIDYGVTIDNLEDTFDWWIKAVRSFKESVLHQ